MDIIYIGIVVVFFVLTGGLMKMCESLGEHKSGEQQ
jgi:hypothetical protein